MSADLCYLSATRALEMFRTKALSPVELLDAQIKRTEAVNPAVNAVVMNYFDEAKEQARKAEQAYMNGGARILEGLTLAVKDEHNIAGKITTNGSLLLQSNVATYTDPICERTIEAGAIVHARTSTPEFSAHYATWSKLWGATRNPWNLKYHVGGSSGGSGAALASGMTTLATGSDIAGSIRMPAAQNGIVGFKPPAWAGSQISALESRPLLFGRSNGPYRSGHDPAGKRHRRSAPVRHEQPEAEA